jgi:hypothetical protein
MRQIAGSARIAGRIFRPDLHYYARIILLPLTCIEPFPFVSERAIGSGSGAA